MTGSGVRWLLAPSPRAAVFAPMVAGPEHRREVLESMRAEGLLVRVAGQVYLPADVIGAAEARAAALAAVTPAWCILGHASAAWLYGAPVPPEPVEVLIPAGSGRRALGAHIVTHSTTVRADEVERRGSLRVTTPARTAADLARWPDEPRAATALAWLLDRLVSRHQVLTLLRSNPRFRHNKRARTTLRQLSPGPRDSP